MRKGKDLLFGNVWKYILVLVVFMLAWSAVFEMLDDIRDNQRLTIGVYNLDYDTQALRGEIVEKLPTLTDQEFLEVYVDQLEHIPNQTYAADILTMQLLRTDLVIMPESLLKQFEIAPYFPELPEALYAGLETYQENGKHLGILLNPAGKETPFTAYLQTDEPCYLLLSSNSVNLGRILNRGEAADDGALQVLYYLLEVRSE